MAGEFELLDGRVRLIQASALSIPLPDASVDCCVTSPPYWGLRNYLNDPDQIGQEKTPQEYVVKMVQVFQEVWRVLKPKGTLWLNLGDTYSHSGSGGHGSTGGLDKSTLASPAPINACPVKRSKSGKTKDLVGIPWRVAFALQEAGWYLRSDIVWAKPNPMPESVRDRPTRSHEYIFLLSKSKKYYYDRQAGSEGAVSTTIRKFTDNGVDKQRGHGRRHAGFNGRYAERLTEEGIPKTRNRRDVWLVATHSFKGAHFATFPPKLIEPCILAGCPENGLVLDPFGGSGTTGKVAVDNNRRAVLLDINYKDEPGSYLEIARDRILIPAKPRPKHRAEEPGLVTGSLFSGEARVQ